MYDTRGAHLLVVIHATRARKPTCHHNSWEEAQELAGWEEVGARLLDLKTLAAVAEIEPPRKKQKVVDQTSSGDFYGINFAPVKRYTLFDTS